MNAVEFADLLAHPNQLSMVAYETLEQLLLEHPYCNGLRMLLLKKYKNDKNSAFERHLMLASMYATDRGRLYDYLHTSVVSNAQVEALPEAAAEPAASDTLPESSVVLVEPPSVYRHKVSENPPMLAFQPPLTAEELAKQPSLTTEEREDWSIMPIEEWLSQPSEPKKEKATSLKESPQRRSFKLSRIPTFKVNMNDFLEGKETQESPVTEELPAIEESTVHAVESSESVPSDEADVFDFFMQQTNSFLQSLHARKEGKPKPVLDEELEDQSTDENDAIISETLAELLAAQGQNAKAIKMYAALSLKFPEKSRLFADRIAALKV